MRNDLRARQPSPGDELEKGIRDGGRRTAGRREQHARDDPRGLVHAQAADVGEMGLAEPRLHTGVVSRGPNVADAAVGAGLEVAGEVVVRERQGGQRGDIRRDDELQNHAKPAP
jgi:hypothetical protein